jgi:hypothetical protein
MASKLHKLLIAFAHRSPCSKLEGSYDAHTTLFARLHCIGPAAEEKLAYRKEQPSLVEGSA